MKEKTQTNKQKNLGDAGKAELRKKIIALNVSIALGKKV